ncbi:hypothetical protein [Marinobacterium aestuariivivens]|uniref:FHA domain-containing protein n=1 Tax=Marinobacterium aestuariivivens TaxID=1698799 RepID=A0ABW2A652_9GAMM
MLTDQSTNGTYLIDEDGDETFVHRDILSLHGGCLIGLGEVPEADSADSLRARLID